MTDRPRRPASRRLSLGSLLFSSLLLVSLHLPSPQPLLESTADWARSLFHFTRNAVMGPPRVGVQIGHLHAADHPEELASLRVSTGGEGGGLLEVDVNAEVARALAQRLTRHGIEVDLLPATVPPRYRADLFISLHADSSADGDRRGYKSATFRRVRNDRDRLLQEHVDSAYLKGSGLPHDLGNVSGDMLDYYAFNDRFEHSVSRKTAALIVEMGYLSNELDRELLARPQEIAALLERGIVSFLEEQGRLRGG